MAELSFTTEIIHWRGPAPFFYAPVPAEHVETIARAAKTVSYGWGMIPVDATIGDLTFYTTLFPKNGGYLLPLKAAVRKSIGVTVGDVIAIGIRLRSER
ncbi:MAG: DUF1905 domain-containing protein [Candidatus Devosia phytovorans]|uniref:DUF1905 domain-containing protein n=1 Tax=Candidatus Devosia phytovorans TaxID=3121372 RepID=A0AAJ5VVM4_9HYPH|nr:DUF1905 domain-containing protein [Devosia sp.]WEK05217.1 MAG: DUF1905 domain-containing protein [Devosia sp.]